MGLQELVQMASTKMDKLASSAQDQVVMVVVDQGLQAIKLSNGSRLPSNPKKRPRTTSAAKSQL